MTSPFRCARSARGTPESMRPAAVVVIAIAAVACAKTKVHDEAVARAEPSAIPILPAPSADAQHCARLFEPPAGADLLCDEHVLGGGAEIHWRSYGTTETRGQVDARYQRAADGCGASLVFKPPLFSIEKGALRFETFEVESTVYPRCTKAPDPAHRAVVILSEKHDRTVHGE